VSAHRKLVLSDIAFTLRSGDFTALVGSSGSGKSALLCLVAGLDHPQQRLDPRRRRAGEGWSVPRDRGTVFQKYSFYPWPTAADNVAFGMRLRQLPEREMRERTTYFLEVVDLQDAARRLPKNSLEECSSGWPSPAP